MNTSFDVVVIGAGPGGYVAAIRAAQLGLKSAVIEKSAPGGVCLNWGCIPSKNLIAQAETLRSSSTLERIGVSVDRNGLDYASVHKQSRKATKMLSGGVSFLLKKNGVEYIEGTAKVTAANEVTLDDGRTISAKNILIATGSRPMQVPGFAFDEEQVLSSNGILAMTELPESLVILGAGAIGCEFAYVMNSFGVKVTLVELAPHILPTEDRETCKVLAQSFKKSGIDVLTETRATSLEKAPGQVSVALENTKGETRVVNAEKALVVFGRLPNTDDLGLEAVGVELDEQGYVMAGDYCQTNIPSIYAIGDITRTPALAHVASKEGEIAVEHMAGHKSADVRVDPALVPSAIYCEPQVAGFGLREDQAECDNIPYKKAVFSFRGCGKAVAVGKSEGLVKVLVDPESGLVLGGHIVGHNATELIHELLLAKHQGLKPEQVGNMIHAHPTLSEGVMEALRSIGGGAIHG